MRSLNCHPSFTPSIIASDNAKPRARKKVDKREEVVTSGTRQFRKAAKVDTTRVTTVWDFSEDILKLDRAIYRGVRFVLDTGRAISALKESKIDLATQPVNELV